MIQEALTFHIESLMEPGEPVSEPGMSISKAINSPIPTIRSSWDGCRCSAGSARSATAAPCPYRPT